MELRALLMDLNNVFPQQNLVLGYQVGSMSGPEYLWNSDPVSGAEMQHGHTWELQPVGATIQGEFGTSSPVLSG